MGISPLAFTGVSKYSEDFQTILTRSVKIASLPAQLLENEQKGLQEKSKALGELRTSISDLAGKLQNLGKLGAGGALQASSSSSAVQATLGTGASAGTYQISHITSLASAAIATAKTGLASAASTPVSNGDHHLELAVGSETFALNLTADSDNLEGVRDAINALGAGVQASIIDTGAGVNRYFLTVAATATGETGIELRQTPGDSATNVLEVTNPGSNAAFQINGRPVVSKENSVADVIPGVYLDLNSTTGIGETITINIALDRSKVTAALQEFVTAYNSLNGKLSAQIGENPGALAGDSIVLDISARMREVVGFQADGVLSNLAELGVTVDTAGVMSFDSTVVDWMPQSQFSGVFQLLGDGTEGLSRLAGSLYEWSDPLTGLIRQQLLDISQSDSRLSGQISAITDRVSTMQASMMARLQAADTLLATLESQQTSLTSVIESLSTVTNGKRA
ncbi:MAG: flagellar filament capping protein FliD [Acidobacteria bacterium]|nr:flagellar filament capping protein FliD [Acidobacteriota bacterium]